MEIPVEDTTYWCTMHNAPVLKERHHLVGDEVRFGDEISKRHTHHLSFHRCRPPGGRSSKFMFNSSVGLKGQLCYSRKVSLGPMTTEYCTEYYEVWAVGGRPFFYPTYVGLPIGESPDEYFVLQVHYNNPNRVPNVQVDLSIDFYYTEELRPYEGGILSIQHSYPGVPPSLLIRPSSHDHKIYGFCGGECAKEMLPPEGISFFGALLHSHNAGAAMKLQHFRGNKELPWIQSDNSYDFNYQQTRVFNQERRVLRGDILAIECTYDNTATNGTVVGGPSSQQEMCMAFVHYYTKIRNHVFCGSVIQSGEGRRRFLGIDTVTWSNSRVEFIMDQPSNFSGLKVTQEGRNYKGFTLQPPMSVIVKGNFIRLRYPTTATNRMSKKGWSRIHMMLNLINRKAAAHFSDAEKTLLLQNDKLDF